MKTTSAYKLFAANNTPINTYGEKTLRLTFLWTFIIADVKTSIIGADFLRLFKLLVDNVTDISTDAYEVATNE